MDEKLERQRLLANTAELIELKPVISNNVSGIGYNESNHLLKVAFKSGKATSMYLYENVEPETYNKIINAESIGKCLNEMVIKHKDKYNYLKL